MTNESMEVLFMLQRVLFLFCILIQGAFAAQYPVKIGDSTVIIKQQSNGCGKAFVHLHQNETTALKAARNVVNVHGGSVLTLVHSGGRNVVFHMRHKRYEFDPNRIFTDRGIKKTLKQHGLWSLAAHRAVKKLARKIISLLPQGKIIAVHNNSTWSLREYMPGHSEARNARAYNVNKGHFYRNFYVVTKQRDYVRLKQLNFNSVWQADHAKDDGSLSVFLAKNRYVNVEAGYNQLAAQVRMLRYA
jgi:hypothetical protein